jgi:hypothetical protein
MPTLAFVAKGGHSMPSPRIFLADEITLSAPRGRVDFEALKRPRLGGKGRAMMIVGCDLHTRCQVRPVLSSLHSLRGPSFASFVKGGAPSFWHAVC